MNLCCDIITDKFNNELAIVVRKISTSPHCLSSSENLFRMGDMNIVTDDNSLIHYVQNALRLVGSLKEVK